MFENLITLLQQYLDNGDEDSLDSLEYEFNSYSEEYLELISNMLSLMTTYSHDDRVTKRIRRISQISMQRSYV